MKYNRERTAALDLINLYVSPTMLSAVERKASVTELSLTIEVFAPPNFDFENIPPVFATNTGGI